MSEYKRWDRRKLIEAAEPFTMTVDNHRVLIVGIIEVKATKQRLQMGICLDCFCPYVEDMGTGEAGLLPGIDELWNLFLNSEAILSQNGKGLIVH